MGIEGWLLGLGLGFAGALVILWIYVNLKEWNKMRKGN